MCKYFCKLAQKQLSDKHTKLKYRVIITYYYTPIVLIVTILLTQ